MWFLLQLKCIYLAAALLHSKKCQKLNLPRHRVSIVCHVTVCQLYVEWSLWCFVAKTTKYIANLLLDVMWRCCFRVCLSSGWRHVLMLIMVASYTCTPLHPALCNVLIRNPLELIFAARSDLSAGGWRWSQLLTAANRPWINAAPTHWHLKLWIWYLTRYDALQHVCLCLQPAAP